VTAGSSAPHVTFTSGPDNDPIVFGALLADADYLISDDKHIVPGKQQREYDYEDRKLLAVPFNYLLSQRPRSREQCE